jgi:hypothetical protein
VDAFGRKVQGEQLDGDESIVVWMIGAKDRSERACADLVENTKRTEGFGMRGAGGFRVQWCSSGPPPRQRAGASA